MLEVSDQLLWCGEPVQTLFAAEMSVIAFANLVVVAKHAYTVYNVRQPELEAVSRTRHWFRKLPKYQLCESCCGIRYTCSNKLNNLHVGDSANMRSRCQLLQRLMAVTERPNVALSRALQRIGCSSGLCRSLKMIFNQ